MFLIAGRIYYLAYSVYHPRLQIFERDGFTEKEFEIFNNQLEKFTTEESKKWCSQVPCTGFCDTTSDFITGGMREEIFVLEPKETIEIKKAIIASYRDKATEIYFNDDAEKYFKEFMENNEDDQENDCFNHWSWFHDAYVYTIEAHLDLYLFNIIFDRCFSTDYYDIDEIVSKCNELKGQKIISFIPDGDVAKWSKWKLYNDLGEEIKDDVKNIPGKEFYLNNYNDDDLRVCGSFLECAEVDGVICENSFIAYPTCDTTTFHFDNFTFCPHIISEKIDRDMIDNKNCREVIVMQYRPFTYVDIQEFDFE